MPMKPQAWLPAIQAQTSLPGDGDRRDLRLDACRGLALWFILVDHIPDSSLDWFTPRKYGLSDASEVFVFVSGYTCMHAYGGGLREQGWPTTLVRALRRCGEIYAAFLLLLMAYFALVWLVGDGHRYLDETNTRIFFEKPGAAILHAAAVQYAPLNTDILPTFVLLHLAFPGVLWLFTRNTAVTLGASLLIYLMVQLLDWHVPAWPSGELYFNPLAWQLLFVLGAWYSCEATGRLKAMVQSRAALVLAMLYLAFSLSIAFSWQIEGLERMTPDWLSVMIYPIDKSHLSPLRVLHFLALAIVVSRLMPPDWRGLLNQWTVAMIRCGENSLAMYCLSVLLSFFGYVILVRVSGTFAMQVAVGIAGIALLIGAATLMTWTAKQDRPGPKLF